MNITYFEQNLPQEFLCEICAQVCKFAKNNLETGFIYCHECCYEYDNIIKMNRKEWRDSKSRVQLLKLHQMFKSQLTNIEKTDQNYKIICRSTFCQKQLDLSEVRLHFKNCEFQQKSCHFCEHWSGTKGDYQIHKQMCYQDCDKFDQQINRLNLELKTQEIQKRILQKKQIQIQNKLVTLMQWNEENK